MLVAILTGLAFSIVSCNRVEHKDDSTPGQIEPFGFKAGMTKQHVIATVGASSVREDDGDLLVLSTAPKPYEDFDKYIVYVSRTKGIAKVAGISKPIETNSFGDQVKKELEEVQTALEKKYGKPTETLDFLQTGSEWKEPQYWMMGLLKKERHLVTVWHTTQGTSIMLLALAASPELGSVGVYYEFGTFPTWMREHDEEKNKSL
jgi:hypothetical protein